MRMPDIIPIHLVAERAAGLGFDLDSDTALGLSAYLGQLMKWNKAMNLVGPTSWEETFDTLVVDSLYLARFLPRLDLPSSPECWDLGAGAGLPGIPLRLVWRPGKYTLVEAREKRALFMRTALAGITLENTTVHHGRAEDFFRQAGRADCILSRAFMPWRDLLVFIREFLAEQGLAVLMTLEPPSEMPAGWRLAAAESYPVGGDIRHLWALARSET